MPVSIHWGSICWVSLQLEPTLLASLLGRLIFGTCGMLIMSLLGNDMSVHIVFARDVQHGSKAGE